MQCLSISSLLGFVGGVTIVVGSGGAPPSVTSLTVGNLTFGSSASKLVINAETTSSVSVINAAAVVLNNVTVDFNSSQTLSAGTYTLIQGTSMSGTATPGTLPPGLTWSSLNVSGNNLVAVLVTGAAPPAPRANFSLAANSSLVAPISSL